MRAEPVTLTPALSQRAREGAETFFFAGKQPHGTKVLRV